MNMNRIADAVKKDPAMKSSLMDMAGRESVQADSDWDNQSNAFGTHPGLFGQVPLYPGLLQKKSRAGSLPPTPPAANPNLQADALQLDGEGIEALQLDGEEGAGRTGRIHEVAASGIQGAGGALPHLDSIQKSFGKHDVSSVQAHTDQHAKDANQALGANAYATGSHVALDDTSLHTVAHEAAHVVQQRNGIQLSGGVGKTGDQYEQHADQVADLVVQGKSAEHLLNRFGGGGDSSVQMDESDDQPKEEEKKEEDAGPSSAASDDSATQAKMSGSRNGLLQLDEKTEEEEKKEADEPGSATSETAPTQAKAIDAGNGLIQLEEEEKKEEDAPPSSASEDSATQAKASMGGNGLLQLDSKDDADAAATSDAPAPSGKKKSPVKAAQALAQVKSAPSATPAEAPSGETKTAAGEEAVIVRPMVESKEDADTASATAPETTAPTQAKAKSVQLEKKPASKEGNKYGMTPPKLMWNGLTFEGIEGDINREFYKSEFPKKKLFKVGHYWPFPAFPFAGIDTAAGADIQPEIAVAAKGTYKWNPVESKYEFKGSFEASAAVTLTLWARGGLAINLVIQSGGVGLEASSSIEAKATGSASAGFKLDGKTGAREGDIGLNLDIGATWKAALALAVWTEGWFYDDIWKYTFAEMTIGTLTGFKMNAGWKSGQGFSWGVDPSSGTFNWGAAPDNPQK